MPTIEEQAAAATATLAQLTKDYQSRPDVRLAAAMEKRGAMGNADTMGLVAADREIAKLRQEVERAGTTAEPIYLTDQQRVDHALTGITDQLGANVTSGDQVPLSDFAGAVGDLANRGVRDDAIASFLTTGHIAGEDRETQIAAAQQWKDKLMRDEDMQRRLFAGDPEIVRQFNYFAMYAAAPHESA